MSTSLNQLNINLDQQRKVLISQISPNAHATALASISTTEELLPYLSRLLFQPAFTSLVASCFRPILIDLCARWLDIHGADEEEFVALCLLIEVHEELFPVLYQLLQKDSFKNGPLTDLHDSSSTHRRLLAYYRLLKANADLPRQLMWPVAPLQQLMWTPELDNGTRLLAILCFALHVNMPEMEREKIEREVFGEPCEVDCVVEYGCDPDGSTKTMDGWILPLVERRRIQDARNTLMSDTQDFFTQNETSPGLVMTKHQLSPRVADIHGILLLRLTPQTSIPNSTFVPTSTALMALQSIALHYSLRVPMLLTSSPSSGKTLFLSHLAQELHPHSQNHIVTLHLADTSLDARSLMGYYVSSKTNPGTFEWKEGVLVRAMRDGKWVVLKDIDRSSSEVLGVLRPLIESCKLGKWVGGQASLDVPGRGVVVASHEFAIFATRSLLPSRNGIFPSPVFLGSHNFFDIVVPSPSEEDIRTIIDARYPRLSVGGVSSAIISLWEDIRRLGSVASTRDIQLRELEKYSARLQNIVPSLSQAMDVDNATLGSLLPSDSIREEFFLAARDVFFGAGYITAAAQAHSERIAEVVAKHLSIDAERQEWLTNRWIPDFDTETDVNGQTTSIRVGGTRLNALPLVRGAQESRSRPFALHRPAKLLLSRISSAVALGEPLLLTGETGTGKTSVITYLASLLRHPLISLNLSHQTESSDLLGGFKPIDARIAAAELQDQFAELFGLTFSRRKNEKFETEVRRAVTETKWKRVVALWRESIRLARDRIRARDAQPTELDDTETPRKRRKVEAPSNISEERWAVFEGNVDDFDVQHVKGKSKFAFQFVEGPLVKAMRSGNWILLDEINLASPETLESISALLQSPTASISLTEHGSSEPVERHPDFRIFACMNPATDVGKKDLPPNIRSRFTEIDVPSPDADRETLMHIITQYIGSSAVGGKAPIMDVAEFYSSVKQLAQSRQIADGSNHRPLYSMRTLARALTFTADVTPIFGLRRALWEGCLMAFTMVLNPQSAVVVTAVADKHLLSGVKNVKSLLSKIPPSPQPAERHVKFGPFYLECGPLPLDAAEHYIVTQSVQEKLVDLSRIILTRQFPVLIEGPTSSGKTSSVEYLARRTGHRFVRINNHEHTDIQEYIGSYIPDPQTGKLVFSDGLLVRALRHGDWLVLDELNLAPTDVLEALNRLLDDNRELVIPETQEVVKPHPHFMLFATQNPPGMYGGRKILSRAFRNRFLEVHFDDVPQGELEEILVQRCQIAPTYGKKIVKVFYELQKRRQTGRVFESKHGFATLRDLFRWARRGAVGYQELAEDGYMLLAERVRREDDKLAVKEVIEEVMGVRIHEQSLYDVHSASRDIASFLDCPVPAFDLVWTSAMQKLFILVSRALRFNEPVLLVGETGSGKTSVCQVLADATSKRLLSLNCHQNTETADLIGGLRPLRNRAHLEAQISQEVLSILQSEHLETAAEEGDSLETIIERALQHPALASGDAMSRLVHSKKELMRARSIFEWHDGPLVEAMRNGDMFLLDEISLADDSVLERLNSVLETERTVLLAEKGGDDSEDPMIVASPAFKLVATMNPGGDYGKKELSPALRNRFTEIWVPAIDDLGDLRLIIDAMWKDPSLVPQTPLVLEFVQWLSTRTGDPSLLNLRDILAWVTFSNSAVRSVGGERMPVNLIFHHAAHMTYLDGLGLMSRLAGMSSDTLSNIRRDASTKLQELAPVGDEITTFVPAHDPAMFVQLGTFAIPRGPNPPTMQKFNFAAPTTQDNAMRVIRACQVLKPVLLEGSPGVGKTSLVDALAKTSGYTLHRVNLSDQTDLIDLFGSDLPVEGGKPGEFAWKDAEFLTALQEGHWVLLDEMNLAPQAVLEGLNAVLDHRGTVYLPELGRSFQRHPNFRVFAAQNPLGQGGGRKGLPKSFVNRFTKVYVQELTSDDAYLVASHLFPHIEAGTLRAMIFFNSQLQDLIGVKRAFAHAGSPWEFNLRDIMRWCALLSLPGTQSPDQSFQTIYTHRFRTSLDRERVTKLYRDVMQQNPLEPSDRPSLSLNSTHLRIGTLSLQRHVPKVSAIARPSPRILQAQLPALESLARCIDLSWLSIITGSKSSGKTALIRKLAELTGHRLFEVSINSATDTMDILGGFEQFDDDARALTLTTEAVAMWDEELRTGPGSRKASSTALSQFRQASTFPWLVQSWKLVLERLHEHLLVSGLPTASDLVARIETLVSSSSQGRFEWVDGPLVRAMKQGDWILLDAANLCNPSVLDRLNSLCEADGMLILSERGYVQGRVPLITPASSFRLFMSVDPQHGELSRAMRNRGVELFLDASLPREDAQIISDHMRLPTQMPASASVDFERLRRGMSFTADSSSSASSSGLALTEHSSLATLSDRDLLLVTKAACSPVDLWKVYMRLTTPIYWNYMRRLTVSPLLQLQPTLGDFFSAIPRELLPAILFLREQLTTSIGVVSTILDAQPMDFYIGFPSKEGNTSDVLHSPHVALLNLLEFIVAVMLDKQLKLVRPSRGRLVNARDARVVEGIEHLANSIQGVVQDAVSSLGNINAESMHRDLPLLTRVMRLINQLLQTSSGAYLDYAAVQAVISMIGSQIADATSHFEGILGPYHALSEAVAPLTGLGLQEIWSAFLSRSPESQNEDALHLEALCHNLSLSSDLYELRRAAFDLMSVTKLAIGKTDASTYNTLLSTVSARLQQSASDVPAPAVGVIDNLVLTIELSMLGLLSATKNGLVARTAMELINIACRQPQAPLSRLIPLHRMTWALSEGLNSDAHDAGREFQRQWLRDFCETEVTSGERKLLQPVILERVLSISDWSNPSLAVIDAHVSTVLHTRRLLTLQCTPTEARAEQLQDILLSSIVDLWSFFEPHHDAKRLKSPLRAGEVSSLFNSGERVILNSSQLLCAALDDVERSTDRGSHLASLGRCYVLFCQWVLELYVPDTPMDPASAQIIARDLLEERASSLRTQSDLHIFVERETTGDDQNAITRYLAGPLQEAVQDLTTTPDVPRRSDVARLHSYWAEVRLFQSQMISPAKVETLVTRLLGMDHSAHLQEPILQQSIAGFCQRLDTAYNSFGDMSRPIQHALSHLQLGLYLVKQAHVVDTNSPLVKYAHALVAFPSVRSSELVKTCNDRIPREVRPIDAILLRCAQLDFESRTGVIVSRQSIEEVAEQASRLWLMDNAREAAEAEASNSLYKSKRADYDMVTDAEREEVEFRELFPTFQDVLDDSEPPKDALHATRLHSTKDELRRFGNAIVALMTRGSDSDKNEASWTFGDARKAMLSKILQKNFSALHDLLDRDARAVSIALLEDHNRELEQGPAREQGSYNFYHDSNVPQIRRAHTLLVSMVKRLDSLIAEWPDQMVLQHLKERCEATMALKLHSPVAKILMALEQLLLQSEDWESYANRHNTLKTHREAIVELIVEWRRLELSSWPGLLDAEFMVFQDTALEWWFRLYDAIFRGPALQEENLEEDTSFSTYLDTLIPLLDDFIKSSPLGQFQRRLDLLQAFATFTSPVVTHSQDAHRVHSILQSTLRYYNMFSASVAQYLTEQRLGLEKEIRSVVKLASWRDVNVFALKQSAQKSHHQLYKLIRKFREVLRHPAADRLLISPKDSAPTKNSTVIFPVWSSPDVSLLLSPSPEHGAPIPQHLRALPKTYSKFQDFLIQRIRPFIEERRVSVLEDLSTTIIETSNHLSSINIPSDLPTEKRTKLGKSLLVRKRKAWSDLLKELKRIGLTSNVKTETLEKLESLRWMREQPPINHASAEIQRGEEYFAKLSALMVQLRHSISTHHSDLTTREIKRGLMFLESAFFMSVESRSRLAQANEYLESLHSAVRRLDMIRTEAFTPIDYGKSCLEQLDVLYAISCKAVSALKEVSTGIQTLIRAKADVIVPDSVFTDLRSTAEAMSEARLGLHNVMEHVRLSEYPIILPVEQATIQKAATTISRATASCIDWLQLCPYLDYLLSPTIEWLKSVNIPQFEPVTSPLSNANGPVHAAVDACLVAVQDVLSRCESPEDKEESPDNYLRSENSTIQQITLALDANRVLTHVQDAIRSVSQTGPTHISSLAPFITRYIELAEHQLLSHAAWNKALFKLCYVLCSLNQTLVNEGFCKPPEGEGAEAEGGADEVSQGTGLGEGTGAENVSKEIEDESQVEGLQGEDEKKDEQKHDQGEKDDTVEMADDFAGDLEDVPDDEGEEGAKSDDEGSEQDPDEAIGDLDTGDPSAVDEKLWGDEKGEEDEAEQKMDQDRSNEKSGESDVVAKENNEKQQKKDKQEPEQGQEAEPADDNDEGPVQEEAVDDNEGPDSADAGGAPMEEHVPDADTLDLPDDLDLGKGEEEGQDNDDLDLGSDDDAPMDDGPPDEDQLQSDMEEDHVPPTQQDSAPEEDKGEEKAPFQSEDVMDEDTPQEDPVDHAVAQPDVTSGENAADSIESVGDVQSGEAQGGKGDNPSSTAGNQTNKEKDPSSEQQPAPEEAAAEISDQADANGSGTAAGVQQGPQKASHNDQPPLNNPLRSLGDTLKEIKQRFDQILENEGSDAPKPGGDNSQPKEVEYLHPDDNDQDMQALGPAGEEQAARLDQLHIVDDEEPLTGEDAAMDVDLPDQHEPVELPNRPLDLPSFPSEGPASESRPDVEGAVVHQSFDRQAGDRMDEDLPIAEDEPENAGLEAELREWQSSGLPDAGAERMWHQYESLTHDLAYALCEQLRLILAPTLATRLKGDYRTGKRLNMKKIIPYIASDYTKDKIWLRRTKPSQREYQILIALDDSRSMAESHSVHLAFQTLALVSKALSLLEAGDIGIARFGETVEMLHSFDHGAPFNDAAGVQVMQSFKFNQKATNVLSLLDTSLHVLEGAREKRSSASAGELWQLEIIISDGICQDHEKLRAQLRRAEEQRVMVVFVVIDSMQTAKKGEGSILSMERAEFKNVNGKMELQLERYLDSFPFQYYVVLRNVEALPEVLSETLKQFFERISED